MSTKSPGAGCSSSPACRVFEFSARLTRASLVACAMEDTAISLSLRVCRPGLPSSSSMADTLLVSKSGSSGG
eukprot:11404424-Heterocapsa_arctica.AAC.1